MEIRNGKKNANNKKIVAKRIFAPILCDMQFCTTEMSIDYAIVFPLSLFTARHGIDRVCVYEFTWNTRNALNVSIPVIQSVCNDSIEQICSL